MSTFRMLRCVPRGDDGRAQTVVMHRRAETGGASVECNVGFCRKPVRSKFRTKTRHFTDSNAVVGWHLAKKILSPTFAPAHEDNAPYFFFKKTFLMRWRNMCFNDAILDFWAICGVTSPTRIFLDDFFRKKKYVAMSPRSGAYVGEGNVMLSAIRRSWLFVRN